MATERIEIIVTEKGARQVRRSLEDISTGANKAYGSTKGLSTLLKGAFTLETIRVLQLTADSYTQILNSLKQVTDGSRQLKAVTDELYAISQRTRTSFEGNAEAYRRFALAGRDLGLTQRDVLQFTESVNQAVAISGASFVEAHAGIIQFSQGLASGSLKGDELRSVLEQLPAIADVIAKQLGVTRSELRNLGADGKITSDIIIEAFKNARGELTEKFAKTAPTISQAFAVLRNSFVKFVGEFDQARGISQAIAKAIIYLSENFELLARAAAVLGTVIATNLVRQGLVLLIAALSNPITLVIALITLFVAFADRVKVTGAEFATVMDLFIVTAQEVGRVFYEAFSAVLSIFGVSKEQLDKGFNELATIIIEALKAVPTVIITLFADMFNWILGALEDTINGALKIGNIVRDKLGLEQVDFQVSFSRIASTEGLLQKAEYMAQQRELAEAQRKKETQSLQAELDKAINGTGVNSVKPPIDKAAQKEVERALKRQKDLLDEIKTSGVDYEQVLGDLNALQKTGQITTDEYTRAMDDLNKKVLENDRTLQGGYQRGLLQLKDHFGDLASLAENSLVNAFQAAEDALVEFVTTGKLDFKSFADSIIADLARIAIRQSIIQPILTSFFGLKFADGGMVPRFADGGLTTGIGGPKADKNLVAVSPGEFIINADATKKYLPLLQAINGGNLGSTSSTMQSIPMNLSAGSSSMVYAPTIAVTVEAGGSGGDRNNSPQAIGDATAKALDALLEQKFTDFAMKARRPGGMFNEQGTY